MCNKAQWSCYGASQLFWFFSLKMTLELNEFMNWDGCRGHNVGIYIWWNTERSVHQQLGFIGHRVWRWGKCQWLNRKFNTSNSNVGSWIQFDFNKWFAELRTLKRITTVVLHVPCNECVPGVKLFLPVTHNNRSWSSTPVKLFCNT